MSNIINVDSAEDAFLDELAEPERKRRRLSTVGTDNALSEDQSLQSLASYYDFENPKCVIRATKSFESTYAQRCKWLYGGNFLKGIYWSPDGISLLSNSNDRTLRMFHPFNALYQTDTADATVNTNENKENKENNDAISNVKQMTASVTYKHNEPINDVTFYPLYNQNDYNTCKFISASRDSPIYMYDSWQDKKCAQYSYMVADAIVTPHSVSFDPTGNYILAGYEKYILEYNISKSDGSSESINNEIHCVNRNKFGQKSIISCIEFYNQSINIFASGSYDGICQLFDRRVKYAFAGFKSHANGITCIKFSPCSNYLLTGARNGNHILCWDLRKLKTSILPYFFQSNITTIDINNNNNNNTNNKQLQYDGNTRVFKNDRTVCAIYERIIKNSQRVLFDIDKYSGRYIVSGNHDGYVSVYDVYTSNMIVNGQYNESNIKLKHPCRAVTSAILNPKFPYLATATGERIFEYAKYKKPIWKIKEKLKDIKSAKSKMNSSSSAKQNENEKKNENENNNEKEKEISMNRKMIDDTQLHKKNDNDNDDDNMLQDIDVMGIPQPQNDKNDQNESKDKTHKNNDDIAVTDSSSDSDMSDDSDSDSDSDDSSSDLSSSDSSDIDENTTFVSVENVNDIYIWDLSVKQPTVD